MVEETRHRGLGRGLSALIGDDTPVAARAEMSKAQRTLPVAFLKPNRFQPRKTFAQDDLTDLANSIRAKGVLQPILVRPIAGEANAFEIVAGERRWRAAQLAKLHDVPVVVRELSDSESLELAIIENVQRADLNAIEEAAAYHELMDRFAYTQEKLAQDVGKSRSHVANTLRLLKLPESVKVMIRDGRLSAGHARTLVGAPDAEARARAIVEAGLNVREAEAKAKPKPKTNGAESARAKDADTKALESSIGNILGLSVEIAHRGAKGGDLKIAYKTLEQLDDLVARLSRSA
ncbi:MAG TPA: ParB/RepB/Spo0J family partition protein [Rhizomicrobium sp.]|jgi:ParB family chromosome partitioning protein|nr:ParB/RepB/Spo0J family partition protein [Rhizomicrobium sp.]